MVQIFEQEKRCRVVWLCDLHSGHAGVGYVLGSIALRYIISTGDLPARNCAKVRLVRVIEFVLIYSCLVLVVTR